jgi:hypothetical protein
MSQIQRTRQDGLAATGTFTDARAATAALRAAAEAMNLVSPSTSVGTLPEGCAVALSHVMVDLTNERRGNFTSYVSGDVYDVGMGKLGLSKTVLQRIGSALGVSWDPVASGRIDDGSDPYYCRWRAVGKYRSFDGQVQTIVAEKEMDLRDGSPQLQALEERARAKGKSSVAQVREMRLHIQSHAETKAQLRALRSMGIRTAYTAAELEKPFVVARVMFTGQTQDPTLKRVFAEKLADSFLDATRSLYGASSAPQVQPTAPLRLSAPPPVGSVPAEADDDYDDGDRAPAQVEQRPTSSAPAQTSQEAPTSKPATAPSGFTIPGGKSKGTPLESAALHDLTYWAERIGKELEADTSRNPERDGALHRALCEEIAKRESQY